MIQSMTAFSRSQDTYQGSTLCWEIRTVNHRYLDISFRLPEAWRYLEMPLRSIIREQIGRGKIECQLKVSDEALSSQAIHLNEKLFSSLLNITTDLAKSKQLQNDVGLSFLLMWPGVVQSEPIDKETIEDMAKAVVRLFSKTVQSLTEARSLEGQSLKAFLQEKLTQMQQEVFKASACAESQVIEMRDKFLTRLQMLALSVDKTRLEQEIALMVMKMDVTEELTRLETHLKELFHILEGATGPSGRRLDFLMQELHREANTLGSKSESMALSQASLLMKVLIDQMREQIQNIE